MPKISVIVPVYNVEKYIDQCIQSVLNQTYTDYELLLIDDGSTDLSGMICDKYEQQDSRVKVFHKPNGGISSARNLGISNAKGEYVIFIDSDDFWLSEVVLKELITAAETKRCDIVRGEIQYVGEDGTFGWSHVSSKKKKYANRVISNDLFVDNIVCRQWYVFLSLYRLTLIKKFNEDYNFQEDIEFHIRVFIEPLKCMYIPIIFYAYRLRSNSLSSIKLDNIKCSFRLCDVFDEYSKVCADNRMADIYQYYSIMMYYWTLCTISEFYWSERLQIIKDYNLKDIQKKVALRTKGKVLKYPISVFLNPNRGCMVLKVYIKMKRVTYNLINNILRR